MRVVRDAASLPSALAAARREALNAFGDDTLLVERYVSQPRHVEIQVFGDAHGRVVHLFERECSIQRRYQKVIEEAPSPGVDAGPARRAWAPRPWPPRRRSATSAPGRSSSCWRRTAQFYFLEVNTRLQVEHPVTELVTGLDLVRLQLRRCGRASAAASHRATCGSTAMPSKRGSTRRIPRATSSRRRAGCSCGSRRRCRTCDGTRAWRRGPMWACTTIRCSPR